MRTRNCREFLILSTRVLHSWKASREKRDFTQRCRGEWGKPRKCVLFRIQDRSISKDSHGPQKAGTISEEVGTKTKTTRLVGSSVE